MNFGKYFTRKPIATIIAESESKTLVRTLNGFSLVLLGIGAIIGAGIFVLTGQAAAEHAGPAIVLSFVIAGIACGLAAFCYAELASTLPVAGSAYTYAYATLGEFAAWCMAWLLLLEYGLSAATVAVGWSGYLVSFLKDFGIIIPIQWASAYGSEITLDNGEVIKGIFNLPAFASIMFVTWLLVIGIKESAKVNNVIVFIKVGVILTFIAIGVFYIDTANWTPFIPENQGGTKYGYDGILKAAGIIFFAYIGFETVSTAAQETINPKKNVPIGIMGSLIICTILYIIVSLVLTGVVPYTSLSVPDPMAVAVDNIGLGWLSFLIKVGAIMGLSSVMLTQVYGQTRVFYMVSHDGLLPKSFSKIHEKFKTPYVNTIITGLIVGLGAGLTPLSTLGDLVSMGTLFAFSIVCVAVIVLRKKAPELKREFTCPLVPWVPLAGVAACLYLIYGIGWNVFVTLKIYFIAGIILYFAYGQFKSKLRKTA